MDDPRSNRLHVYQQLEVGTPQVGTPQAMYILAVSDSHDSSERPDVRQGALLRWSRERAILSARSNDLSSAAYSKVSKGSLYSQRSFGRPFERTVLKVSQGSLYSQRSFRQPFERRLLRPAESEVGMALFPALVFAGLSSGGRRPE